MRVEVLKTIDGIVVKEVKKMPMGYTLYKSTARIKDGAGELYYIAYDGIVMFEIIVVADGDDMAHIEDFDVKFIDENEGVDND